MCSLCELDGQASECNFPSLSVVVPPPLLVFLSLASFSNAHAPKMLGRGRPRARPSLWSPHSDYRRPNSSRSRSRSRSRERPPHPESRRGSCSERFAGGESGLPRSDAFSHLHARPRVRFHDDVALSRSTWTHAADVYDRRSIRVSKVDKKSDEWKEIVRNKRSSIPPCNRGWSRGGMSTANAMASASFYSKPVEQLSFPEKEDNDVCGGRGGGGAGGSELSFRFSPQRACSSVQREESDDACGYDDLRLLLGSAAAGLMLLRDGDR